jgi:hypothetical protein
VSLDSFLQRGWLAFTHDPLLAGWVAEIAPVALALTQDSDLQASWLRHAGTWFVGVNVLPNDVSGACGKSGPLRGRAVDFLKSDLGLAGVQWDNGQISTCYAGYPGPGPGDSKAAHAYRLRRDSAHIDGLMPEGPQRRRHLREYHAFILGIPLNDTPSKAAPFVVWEGSHFLMRAALQAAFDGVPPQDWGSVDVTEIYHQARRDIWDRCRRVEVPARPGQAYIVHRLALHGIAPWPKELKGPREGRMIAYFRPADRLGRQAWLQSA